LASTVNMVLAQRLIRRICPACLAEYRPDEEMLKLLTQEYGVDLKKQRFYKGKGCEECHNKGFKGRVGIYEALTVSDSIKKLIGKKTSSDEIQKQAVAEGMVTLLQDGFNKVSAGLTTVEEVIRAIREE